MDAARAALRNEIRQNREELGKVFDRSAGRRGAGPETRSSDAPKPGVEGRFVERAPGIYVFIPQDDKLPSLTLANPGEFNELAVGPMLRVVGEVDVEGGRLTARSYSLAITAQEPDPEAMEQPVNKARAAIKSAVEALDRGIKPGAMSTNDTSLGSSSSFARETVKSIADLVAAYQQAVESCQTGAVQCRQQDITEIARYWSDFKSGVIQPIFKDNAEDKAIYDQLDNYEPWRYGQVVEDSSSAVAIGEPGQLTARCSGVLIAEDLVLTAAHCFSGNAPKMPGELEVWFNYSADRHGNVGPKKIRKLDDKPVAPPQDRWPEIMQAKFSGTLYDYAIVRIKRTNETLIPNGAKPKCLKKSPLSRFDALYILGYPRGEVVRIHANARVYLPYRLRESDMWRLRLDMQADLLGDSDIQRHMDEFDKSYIRYVDPSLGAMRVFHDTRDTGHPRMAIIADLFKGNSGGPVFQHQGEQCVVGILNRGMPDTGQRLRANWKQHERVLPMEAILEDVQKSVPALMVGNILDIR